MKNAAALNDGGQMTPSARGVGKPVACVGAADGGPGYGGQKTKERSCMLQPRPCVGREATDYFVTVMVTLSPPVNAPSSASARMT